MRINFTQAARKLRKDMTEAERQIWYLLQAKNLGGFKFRRQEPIGRYIVDFVCFEKKVVIEIDGGQHAENKLKDLERGAWLKSQGFTVLRFWNNEVLENREGVMKTILEHLAAARTPSPSPSHRGRGKRLITHPNPLLP